jgi:hypothetical protein
MQTIVLQSNSKSDMELIISLAKKIGIKVKQMTDEEKEEMGLLNAILKGRTGKYVDTKSFIEQLGK